MPPSLLDLPRYHSRRLGMEEVEVNEERAEGCKASTRLEDTPEPDGSDQRASLDVQIDKKASDTV